MVQPRPEAPPADRPPPLSHYVVVREDLPRGTLAAQVVHAAGETSPGGLPHDTHAVVLAARDEAHLAEVLAALERAGLPCHAVREPDAPWCGALMAVGLPPVSDRRAVKRVLGRLPLLR